MNDSEEVKIARLEEQFKHAESALILARREIDRRLSEMNEFREQIFRERKDFVTLESYEMKHELLRTRLEKLEKKDSNMDGRFWMLGAGLTALVVVINLLFKFWGK